MLAKLTNYRQSPRKVRLVANAVKGKQADEALVLLRTMVKRAGTPLEKLLKSGIANAKRHGLEASDLVVKEFRVDTGVTLKRSMPRARGSAFQILKRSSNIVVILEKKK